nr:integrase, catalytic region, zinc finger, CCHC-type, peptidase aspartic, catalytic [Tanacetum cinerariifolium]
MEKVLSDSEKSSSSSDETIAEVSYYKSEFESEYEFETSEYYDNSTNYGLFVDNGDDQEIFHDSSEIFFENHIGSQMDYDQSTVDHNDSEKKIKLINQLIKNVLQEQLKVKHVVIDTHVECQEKYAKLEVKRYEYMIRYSAYFDNNKQHRKQIADQQILFDKMSRQLVEMNENQTSSLKPYILTVILEKIIIDLEDEVVSLLAKEIFFLETIESLKSKGFESSEKEISESKNQNENDCQVVENVCDDLENPNVIAPGMFKLSVSQNLDTLSSVRRPNPSGVTWKKKGSSNTVKADLSSINHSNLNKNVKRYNRKDLLSCNNSHLVDTNSEYDCNAAMHADCNSYDVDVNDLFIFDDMNIKKSQVSKMPFRKKPSASLDMPSKIIQRNLYLEMCLTGFLNCNRCSKHMTGKRALLTNFVEKFLGTVRFGNNDFAVIAGYEDVVIGSMTIKRVYYVEGLGHNLFSFGQFFDKGLEVAFRKSACFVRNENGVDLLTGDRSSNLYTIALNEIASNSSSCLLEKVSSLQSWLWHQCLSYLYFAIINNLVKNNLVRGLPKMKFEKDHYCSACEQGMIHQKHHKSKTAFASNQPLYLLHMDLCGRMHVKNINEK